jgi:hypothetical protein
MKVFWNAIDERITTASGFEKMTLFLAKRFEQITV